MSQLEQEAKPIILKLMRFILLPADLTLEQRILLGRWATKTLYVLASSSRARMKIPSSHYRALAVGGRPADGVVAVAGVTAEPGRILTYQSASWSVASNRRKRDIASAVSRSYKSALAVGHMIVGVGFLPPPSWIIELREGTHTQLDGECLSREAEQNDQLSTGKAQSDILRFFAAMCAVDRAL